VILFIVKAIFGTKLLLYSPILYLIILFFSTLICPSFTHEEVLQLIEIADSKIDNPWILYTGIALPDIPIITFDLP
jgi:hypothetical protein